MNNTNTAYKYGWKDDSATNCHSYAIPKIIELLPSGKLNILDMGCGNGFVAGKLAQLGHQVTGIDISEDGIEIATKKYPQLTFETRSVYDSLSDLGNSFDLIICSEVIEHLYYPQKFLSNAASMLRPGGYLILTTPYHGWAKNVLISLLGQWDKHHTVDWEGGHIKFFSGKTISKMLFEHGFSEIQFNNAGRVRWLWKSMVLRAKKTN